MMDPIVRAFAISLSLHFFLFVTLEAGNRLNLWRFSPLTALSKSLKPLNPAAKRPDTKSPKDPAKIEEKPEDIPLVFVDVDPSQAVKETPPETPYYATVNTLAGNPDTKRDAQIPKFDGRQDRILKTTDSAQPKEVSHPLQPVTPPEKPPEEKPEPKPEAKPQKESPLPLSAPPPKPELKEGDLATAKPAAAVIGRPELPPAETLQPAPPQRKRPRTVQEAKAQLPSESRSAIQGEKMKQEGGVRRFSIQASTDARGSPLGNYDAKFVAAVQQCWYNLLEQHRYSLDRMGKVVLQFRLTYDGRITDMKTLESDVGDIYTAVCQLAVTKPAPFEKWPTDVRRLIGANSREVRFTFYY